MRPRLKIFTVKSDDLESIEGQFEKWVQAVRDQANSFQVDKIVPLAAGEDFIHLFVLWHTAG